MKRHIVIIPSETGQEIKVSVFVQDNELHSLDFFPSLNVMSSDQFMRLNEAIDEILCTDPAHFGNIKNPENQNVMAVSEKGINGFQNRLESMYQGMKNKMSPEDQKMAESAFSLVNKLLGKK